MSASLRRHAIKECGTQMLEMDVRRTKDGVVVVSHDMHLGRLCGRDARVDQGSLFNGVVKNDSFRRDQKPFYTLGHPINCDVL